MASVKNTIPGLGIALGGGSARGWAHIGVLSALARNGIEPSIVCGTSIGALVGGIYAAGRLPELEAWVGGLTRRDVLGLVDVTVAGGGMIGGRKLMDLYRQQIGDVAIEELPLPFAAVATDLRTGMEVWIREGSLLEAIRASISLPGIFTPVHRDGRWLVDGGLVNPVPVSVCRALGAETVIAVDLQGGRPAAGPDPDGQPGVATVIAASFDIVQTRLSRSRLAGDPPDVLLTPRVQHVPALEFAGGRATIDEGYDVVRRMMPVLNDLLDRDRAGDRGRSAARPVRTPASSD